MLFHKKSKGVVLGCFSPPVMMLTLLIETGLILYSYSKYKMSSTLRIAIALLISLLTFQLAEFNVCMDLFGKVAWSNIGYVAISLLPPLGIHFIQSVFKVKKKYLTFLAYFLCGGFLGIFIFSQNALNGHQCLGNYVIFQINSSVGAIYTKYYYGLLILGTSMSFYYASKAKTTRIKKALQGFAGGYLAFIVPTTFIALSNRETVKGIPSIMCGFAIFFAIILGLYCLPRTEKAKSK